MSTVKKEEVVKTKPRLLRRAPFITQTVGNSVSIFLSNKSPLKRGAMVYEVVCQDGAIEVIDASCDIGAREGRYVISRLYRVGSMLSLGPETGIHAGQKIYQVADEEKLVLVPESAAAARGIE
jgi:hypothetical protein